MTLVFAATAFMLMCGFGAEVRGHSGMAQEPVAATTPLSAAQLFKERGCSHCHLLNGDGGRKGPDLSSVGRRMSVDGIRKQILDGGGAMPSYQDALSTDEVNALVEMLHEARTGKR